MSSLLQDSELAHEDNVVWLEDTDRLDYVRQALDKTTRRRGKLRCARDGRMVGYTELAPTPKPTPTAVSSSAASSFSFRTTATANPTASTSRARPVKPSTRAPSNRAGSGRRHSVPSVVPRP